MPNPLKLFMCNTYAGINTVESEFHVLDKGEGRSTSCDYGMFRVQSVPLRVERSSSCDLDWEFEI